MAFNGPVSGEESRRLSAQMASRRLLILEFVQDYIGHRHVSPSYSEIAAGCGTNRTRVKDAIHKLVRDGLLLRRPGPRGLALPSERDAAVRVLSELGYLVFDAKAAVTKSTLLTTPALDYNPAHGETGGQESDSSRSAA